MVTLTKLVSVSPQGTYFVEVQGTPEKGRTFFRCGVAAYLDWAGALAKANKASSQGATVTVYRKWDGSLLPLGTISPTT
jgi:hypothetical protein